MLITNLFRHISKVKPLKQLLFIIFNIFDNSYILLYDIYDKCFVLRSVL